MMTPAQVDAARIIVAAVTAAACGHEVRDAVLTYTPRPNDGDTLTSWPEGALTVDGATALSATDVAMASAALFEKVFDDVAAVLTVDRARTLANAGAWVQAQEGAHG